MTPQEFREWKEYSEAQIKKLRGSSDPMESAMFILHKRYLRIVNMVENIIKSAEEEPPVDGEEPRDEHWAVRIRAELLQVLDV